MVMSIVDVLAKLERDEVGLMQESLDSNNGEEYRIHRAKAESFSTARTIVGNMLSDAESDILGMYRELSNYRTFGSK